MRTSTASAPELLAAYDEQVRRRPVPDGPDDVVEQVGGVVRCVSATGWSGVTYSDLAGRDADAVIAAQLARMTGTWEWKHYSHDEPPDLPERLLAAGFEAEEPGGQVGRRVVRVVLPLPRAGHPRQLRGDRGVRVAAREVAVGDAAPARRGDAADDAAGLLDDVVRAVRDRPPADLLVVGGEQIRSGRGAAAHHRARWPAAARWWRRRR